jgi:hypothetical protein
MVSAEVFRSIACSFPDVAELPHFDLASFRVRNRIFATLSDEKKRAMVKLSPIDQSVFCAFDNNVIYPVPGTWGNSGATYIELKKIRKVMLNDAVRAAYVYTASKK